MTTTETPPTPGDAPTEDEAARPGDEPGAVETVATAATGMVLGGAALWFLAPICFVC
ncbi:MAG TPA: hypothetical protein VLR27_11790 [Acidimicrobiales bacterium]|nr:hypothetical protein [Acidimicrobiales bacterium]